MTHLYFLIERDLEEVGVQYLSTHPGPDNRFFWYIFLGLEIAFHIGFEPGEFTLHEAANVAHDLQVLFEAEETPFSLN